MKALLRVGVQGKTDFDTAPQKRLAYEADFKLKSVNHAKEHGSRSGARKFDINESMVHKWRQQEDGLLLAKKMKESICGNKARRPQLEDRLDRWISQQRAAGRSFSTVAVRIQAKVIVNEMDGRQRWESYAAVCLWILDAWCKVSTTTIIRGFAKANIIPGLTSDRIESAEVDDSEDEDTGDMSSGLLDATTAQLMICDMENKKFNED
ncbi:hypothetical protein TURU_013266 [Turdus rufiventris]|nr:hypothetical protein TURU_013266 [Turdus rufiventris]